MQELSLSSTQVEISNFQTFTTEYVAEHYGVSVTNIKIHKSEHADEIVDGIHFIYELARTKGGKQEILKWTLRGIIKLGMFIRSPQAKNFRLWAEAELERSIKNLEAKAAASKEIVYVDRISALACEQIMVLKGFIRDALIADEGFFVPNLYLYAAYRYYAASMRSEPIVLKNFCSLLRSELAKQGVRIAKGQKRLQAKGGVISDRPRGTYGIKLSPRLNSGALLIDGERIPVSDMNFIVSPHTYSYGGTLLSLDPPPPPSTILSDDRQEELIRQNERLNLENKRLKKALFREKAKGKSDDQI